MHEEEPAKAAEGVHVALRCRASARACMGERKGGSAWALAALLG